MGFVLFSCALILLCTMVQVQYTYIHVHEHSSCSCALQLFCWVPEQHCEPTLFGICLLAPCRAYTAIIKLIHVEPRLLEPYAKMCYKITHCIYMKTPYKTIACINNDLITETH